MKVINEINNFLWASIFESIDLNENINMRFVSEKECDEYIERTEIWRIEGDESDPEGTEVLSAYSKVDGSYIGQIKEADIMVKKWGLSQIQKAENGHSVASIGFNEKKQEWCGWSHRAMCGFGIGDKVFDESFGGTMDIGQLEKMPFRKRGSIVIAKLEQAKKAASNFAKYVS